MTAKPWSHIEDVACLYLFLNSGKKQLEDADGDVVQLARAIGRGSATASYKITNFRGIDPISRGHEFRRVSKTDRGVWDIYSTDHERLEDIFSDILSGGASLAGVVYEEGKISDRYYRVPNSTVQVHIKLRHEKIRIIARILHKIKCAICGIDHPMLLMASHIVPWGREEGVRADPRNLLLLCPLHYRLFDSVLISITDDYTVIVLKELDCFEKAKAIVVASAVKKLYVLSRYSPKPEYLKYHRDHFFRG